LRESFVLKDLETARAIPGFMENPRLFTHYPKAVSRLLESIYTIDERPQAGLFKKVWKGAKRDFMNVATVKDAWSARKI
jgi:electron transfer flavoprotein-quinone oxidoreductase